eukprot:804775-Amorphochlora_amoeboformis.AAC.1
MKKEREIREIIEREVKRRCMEEEFPFFTSSINIQYSWHVSYRDGRMKGFLDLALVVSSLHPLPPALNRSSGILQTPAAAIKE